MSAAPTALCSAWIDGAAVDRCGRSSLVSNPGDLDDVAYDASYLLYVLSGRRYPGVCEWTVRPCRRACPGLLSVSAGIMPPWYWGWFSGSWAWRDESGAGRCGCGSESSVDLAGWVREITQVKIDGDIVDPDTYEVVNHRTLVRRDDPGPPVVARRWPSCQNLTLADDQPGTFVVTYTWGDPLPPLAEMAAAALARELWLACSPGANCALPGKVTKVVRQGITIERVVPIASMLAQGSSGIPLVDAFIASEGGKNAGAREAAVYSPDVPGFPRRSA